ASDPGAARRADHPTTTRHARGAAGGDLRRHHAQPRRALEHPPAADHGRARNIPRVEVMGARVRVVGPPTLMPTDVDKMGVEVHYNMRTGLKDVDIVMMLRLQTERMQGSFVPSISEYFRFFGLDHEKLKFAKPDALVMHPGPMNRGVEI